jgi:hypothetical protein
MLIVVSVVEESLTDELPCGVDVCLHKESKDDIEETAGGRSIHERRGEAGSALVRYLGDYHCMQHVLNNGQMTFLEVCHDTALRHPFIQARVKESKPEVERLLLMVVQRLLLERSPEGGVVEASFHRPKYFHARFHVRGHLCEVIRRKTQTQQDDLTRTLIHLHHG